MAKRAKARGKRGRAKQRAPAKRKRLVAGARKKRRAAAKTSFALLSNPAVRQLLIDMAGENTLNVIKEFKKEMSDEELARRTKIKVSEVRAVLNKMHSHGLVSYTRNRDKDSGWYSYLWKINEGRMGGLLPGALGEVGEGSVESAEEGGEFYVCRSCDPVKRVPFERATELLFKCETCGASLEFAEAARKRG